MRASEAAAFFYAQSGIPPSETPRQRQVREMIARQESARADTARQRRREAKCGLLGHDLHIVEEDPNGPGYVHECRRCGHTETLPF